MRSRYILQGRIDVKQRLGEHAAFFTLAARRNDHHRDGVQFG